MEIFKVFKFDAAHRLPNVRQGHKCSQLHGHFLQCRNPYSGSVDPHSGWVMDFADIAAVCQPIVDQLDHNI